MGVAYMSGHHVHTGGHGTEVRALAQRVEAIAERLGDVPVQDRWTGLLSGERI